LRPLSLLIVACLLPGIVIPAKADPEPPTVRGAWVRASLPHEDGTAAYLTLESATDDTLTGIGTEAAGMAMLHQTTVKGDLRGMSDVDSVPLPAHHRVVLAPRGLHIMLMDLKRPLQPGQSVSLTLHFAHAADLTIAAPVRRTPP
jgi:copper(I)-binding protein